jgi:hypothetical protein
MSPDFPHRPLAQEAALRSDSQPSGAGPEAFPPRKAAALVHVLAVSMALSGCVSARPRPYAPVLKPPAQDQALFERDFTTCSTEVAAGKRNFQGGPAPLVAAGVGGVAATSVLSGAAAGATTVGAGAGLAATGVGILLLVPVATYTLSSGRRKKNEREVQKAMSACLALNGHAVSGWKRPSGPESAAITTRTPTRPTK